MSETQAVEPVAWMARGTRIPRRFGTATVIRWTEAEARERWPDAEVRPLYDADVPALVEALEEIAQMADVPPDHCPDPENMKVFEGIRDEARTALQNARAE